VYSYERNTDAAGQPLLNIAATDKKTLMDRYSFSDGLASAVLSARPRSLMDLLNVKAALAQNRPGAGTANQPDAQGAVAPNQPNQPNQPTAAADSSKLNQITIGWLADHWDELTVSDEPRLPARVNVNTASRDVLLTLPEMTGDTADAILARQGSSQGPFLGVGELLKSGTLSESQFKAMAEKTTVRSNVFEVRSTGTSTDGIRCMIVAVVDRGGQPMSILYWWASQ
jgi:DNA uptake protein ComE-like DNA-binding protein